MPIRQITVKYRMKKNRIWFAKLKLRLYALRFGIMRIESIQRWFNKTSNRSVRFKVGSGSWRYLSKPLEMDFTRYKADAA